MRQPTYEDLSRSGMSPRKTIASSEVNSPVKFPTDHAKHRKSRAKEVYRNIRKSK